MSTDVTLPLGRRKPAALQPRVLWGLSALAFAGFLAQVWLVQSGFWEALDPGLLWQIHAQANQQLDRFFLLVTHIGHQWGVIPLDVALVLVFALLRCWRLSVLVLLCTAGSGLLNSGAKWLFARPRPELWQSLTEHDSWSFPSGHAMGSSTLMLVLVLLAWSGRWRWPVLSVAVPFAALVGFSRLYLGVHWPSDIVAGWLLAAAWVFAVFACIWRQQGCELCLRADIS